MQVSDTQFMALLMARLDKMIEERSAQLVNGGALSFDEYRGRCEAIKALRDVAQACLDISKEMMAVGRAQPHNPAVHRRVDKQEPTYRA